MNTGLSKLTDSARRASTGLNVTGVVAGMLAGADSIDDMAILRRGMK